MALTDFFPKLKQIQGTQAPVSKPKTLPQFMPETIDFAALWDEPKDAGSLQTIMTFVNTGILVIVMLKAFF